MTAKEIVYDRLGRISDHVSLEEIRDELLLMIELEKSMEDVRAGRVYTQEQVEEMSKSWINEARIVVR
ncbi:MAG: hypothetical protein K8T89_17895 [Planctomycetes bacterium]|nr:hypothetical protein [Planctomycetota bacterium]